MDRNKLITILVLCGTAFGQVSSNTPSRPRRFTEFTVSTLPAASTTTGQTFIVTDAATSGSCSSGSGSFRTWCRSNGSTYDAVGDGGAAGGVTSIATTSPITGGTITTTGTIACATCVVTNAANTFTSSGAETIGLWNNIFAVDGTRYTTSQAALNAAVANAILIPSNYATTDSNLKNSAGGYPTNVSMLDLRNGQLRVGPGGIATIPHISDGTSDIPLGPDLFLDTSGAADIRLQNLISSTTSSTSVGSTGIATITVGSAANFYWGNGTTGGSGVYVNRFAADQELLVQNTNGNCAAPAAGTYCVASSTTITANFQKTHTVTPYTVDQWGATFFDSWLTRWTDGAPGNVLLSTQVEKQGSSGVIGLYMADSAIRWFQANRADNVPRFYGKAGAANGIYFYGAQDAAASNGNFHFRNNSADNTEEITLDSINAKVLINALPGTGIFGGGISSGGVITPDWGFSRENSDDVDCGNGTAADKTCTFRFNNGVMTGFIHGAQEVMARFYSTGFSGANEGARINAAFASCGFCAVTPPRGLSNYSTTINIPVTQNGPQAALICEPGTELHYTGSGDAVLVFGIGGETAVGDYIKDCKITGTSSGVNGVHLKAFNNFQFINTTVSGFTTGNGVLNEGANHVVADNSEFDGNKVGWHDQAVTVSATLYSPNSVEFKDSQFQVNTQWGWWMDGTPNIASQNDFSSSAQRVVFLNNGTTSTQKTVAADNATCALAGACRNAGGTVATFITTAAHGLAINDEVLISGVTDTTFNGFCTVTAVGSSTAFSCNNTGTASAHSGSGNTRQTTGNIFSQFGSNFGLSGTYFEYTSAITSPLCTILIGDNNFQPNGADVRDGFFNSVGTTNSVCLGNGKGTGISGITENQAVTNVVNNFSSAARGLTMFNNTGTLATNMFTGANAGTDNLYIGASQGGNFASADVNALGTTVKGIGFNAISGLNADLVVQSRSGATNDVLYKSNGGTTIGTLADAGKYTTAASTTTNASFNIPSGTAPTSPVAGDIWQDTNEEKHVVQTATSGAIKLYDSGGTNAITHTTSGTITSYTVNHPLAAATGVLTGVNASNVITWAHSGDAAHSLSQLAKTAAVTTFTLCAATANTACGQAGQYRISYNFYGSGTACATVTAGSVGLNLTWTDTNAVTHTTISLPLWDQKSAAMTNGLFNFNTALGTEGASGSYIISTNGTIIQAATTYTACTSGTGAYNLKMTVEQLQ